MPIVAVLIFMVVSFAFTGLPGLPGISERLSQGVIPQYAFTAPERKSIIVSPEGEVQRTADQTQPTKRDRSKKYIFSQTYTETQPVYRDQTPVTQVTVEPEVRERASEPAVHESGSITVIEPAPATPASVEDASEPITENVVSADDPTQISVGRKVKEAIIAEPSISSFTRMTINVNSVGKRVMLSGYVMDAQEKDQVHTIAQQIAGVENVDDRLKVMGNP